MRTSLTSHLKPFAADIGRTSALTQVIERPLSDGSLLLISSKMSKRTLSGNDSILESPPKKPRQTVLSKNLTPTIPTLPADATISAPIEDRKSRFIGYFVPLIASSAVARHRGLLEKLPELARADHKIMAWNVGQSTGFDDDGEKWAGRKLLEVLTSNEDQGILCVARWYGGIMLGPARFDHIIHVAADALATYHIAQRKSPLLSAPTIQSPKVNSPTKMAMDENERERLIRVLRAKDMTVESLRAMITAKKLERGEGSGALTSPSKTKNYEGMQVEPLQRLVVARDATIKSLRVIMNELNSNSATEDKSGGVRDGDTPP
jgi:Uncharacterized protein family UPF0029